jgi:hypothetical protein
MVVRLFCKAAGKNKERESRKKNRLKDRVELVTFK